MRATTCRSSRTSWRCPLITPNNPNNPNNPNEVPARALFSLPSRDILTPPPPPLHEGCGNACTLKPFLGFARDARARGRVTLLGSWSAARRSLVTCDPPTPQVEEQARELQALQRKLQWYISNQDLIDRYETQVAELGSSGSARQGVRAPVTV